MLSVIESRRYSFNHNSNSALLIGVAVSGRRCVLFYSNNRYYQYDPFTKQIINQGSLPQKPYKAILIDKNIILCLLQSGKLCRLSFEKGNMNIGCQLPPTKSQDPFSDRQAVLNCEINVFTDTGTYFISMPFKQENRRKIFYFANSYTFQFSQFEFHNVEPVCEKLDQLSQIIIYFQHIQDEVEWDIKIIDLIEGTDRRIVVDNQLLKPGYIVSKILMKSQSQLYMFINGAQPCILLLQIDSLNLAQVKYNLLPNFLDVVFYDRFKNIICLSYLQNVKFNGEITDNVLEIIDLKKLKTISRSNVSLKEISMPIENDYILDIAAEGKPGNSTIFHARHLVRKRAMIFHLMQKSGLYDNFGSAAIRRTLALFDI